MPAKNAAKYLTECIESVLKQTFTNWELIIVDDHSCDETEKIIQRFSNQDERISCLKNPSSGIISALNFAFKHSKGKYITRMDADDLMHRDKLALFVEKIKEKKKTVITGKVQYFSDSPISEGYIRYEKWLNERANQNDFYQMIYRECVIASPNWMVHRSCFEEDILFDSLKYPEDYDLVFRWKQNKYEICSIDAITHLWREHKERTSRTSEVYQQKSFFQLKTDYFISNENPENKPLQLIGTEKKGKLVAKLLIKNKINFNWFDLKEREMIDFNKKILSVELLNPDYKTILTYWPVDDQTQNEINDYLTQKGFVFGENLYLF